MSVGNLKTDGQKGNNFPWQLKMLQGIQGIIDALTAGVCCPPQQRIAMVTSLSNAAGSINNGTYGFSIANIGTAAGTVSGITLPVGVTINFDPGVNNTITGVFYDATGTEFLITYIS
jgi:hypothetical protein